MKNRLLLIAASVALLSFSSCEQQEVGSMSVKFSDVGAATSYEEVVIDVRRVEVKFANANTNNEFGKYFLDAHLGDFDLADLSETGDAEVANKKRMPLGKLTEMRIVVGDGSYIKVNGAKYDLLISNSPNSGLTFPLDDINVHGGVENKIKLKIDLAGSVIQTGGSYSLNPLIEVEE